MKKNQKEILKMNETTSLKKKQNKNNNNNKNPENITNRQDQEGK